VSRSNATGSTERYVRPFPAAGASALYMVRSKNGPEFFYETTDNRVMVVDYSADGGSWCCPRRAREQNRRRLQTTVPRLRRAAIVTP
jgi:hypothetical protein